VIGTTGLPDEIHQAVGELAESQAVLVAENTSLGMALLRRLVATAVRTLGPSFDIDLVEAHRAGKRDAPSGSAVRLADAINVVRDGALPSDRVHSIRSGDIAGEHEVRFSGPGEMIFLSHRASDRDLFARGALTAATWLRGRAAGRYSMDDVLGTT
jgi:4-hydroxy-tetrahydrodipicolinate reductase